MGYDVAEYSDWEYEKYVYLGGQDPNPADMDEFYGKGEWTSYDSSEDSDG